MTTLKSTFQPLHQPLRFFAYMVKVAPLLGLILLFEACKKEELSLPSIQVFGPNTNSLHTYGGSIEVAVKAQSQEGIDKLIVSIKDAAGRQAMPSRLIEGNNETSMTEYLSFDLTDERLKSGNYYISATVYDSEDQSKSDFRDIRIIGAPVVVQGIYALVQSNGSAIYQLNGDGSWSEVFTTSGAYHQMEVNSYDGVIHLIGDATSGLLTLSSDNFSILHQEVIPFGLGDSFFYSSVMDTTTQKLYTSGADDQVYQFNSLGLRQLSYDVPRSTVLSIQNNALLSYSVQNLTQRRLELYSANSGFFRQSLSIADDVVQLFPAQNENQFIYVANDENGSGVLRIYDVENNYLDQWEIFLQNPNTSPISSAYRTAYGVVVCHSDQVRYYTFNGSDYTQSPMDILSLAEDKIGGRIYAASALGVYQLDQQLNTLNFFDLPNTVDIDVVYNK
ncbi:MAG: hypothetical protein ACOVOO_03800 [Flavobacteriales bacterium]